MLGPIKSRSRSRVWLLWCAICALTSAAALPSAAPADAPDVDRRFGAAVAAPNSAQRALLRDLGDVEVGWNRLGMADSLRAHDGALTGPSNTAPQAIALGFLRDNAALWRQRPADVGKLRLTMVDRDASGATFLRYAQTHDNRPVHGASMLVAVDQLGRVVLAGGLLAPTLDTPPAAQITAREAVARTAREVSPRRLPPAAPRKLRSGVGTATFENTMALEALRDARPVRADLVTVPTATGGRLAWQVTSEVASDAEYETLVDARSGAILFRENHIADSGPRGLVHTGENPAVSDQVPNVPFNGIDGSWVSGDSTAGNNAIAYQDLPEDDTRDAGDYPVNADQHFDYPFTDTWGTTGVISTSGDERDAVVTQLFYYTNWVHDYVYGLGFTETARNFQEDNFGRGGTGGDPVNAETDDGYGTGTEKLCVDDGVNVFCRNNANFNTNGADGARPRMQMYVTEPGWASTQTGNDLDVVIHEYAHGITGRIISDHNLQGGKQSGALGEGWSDAFSTSILDDPVVGEYVTGDPNGVRGLSYADDSLEYGDFSGGSGVHTNGRIWGMAMWEQRAALVEKHGYAAGKALHEGLLMLGIKATPDTPSFHDARSGYLTADALLELIGFPNAGNQCLIWRVFADNELGVTGAPDLDTQTNPTVSTDTPDSCDAVASIAPPADVPEGSPVTLDAVSSTVGGDPGDVLEYEWDLDEDGDYDDATGATIQHAFADDGIYTVGLRVTNTAGYSDTASADVTVANVAPAVAIDAAQATSLAEGGSIEVLAHFTDPGWGDTHPTAKVSPGTAALPEVDGTLTPTQSGPPQEAGDVSATLAYGDNGTFTVEVRVQDDDGGVGTASFPVTVTNDAPAGSFDESQTIEVNGIPTLFVDAGETAIATARITDEGSDDETVTFAWDDGTPDTVSEHLVQGPLTDALPSPQLMVRDFSVSTAHAWAQACTYDAGLTVTDDDGGSAGDTLRVLITAPPTPSRGAGYWQHKYRGNGKTEFTAAQLDCYLEIVGALSDVFHEVRDASTRAAAHDGIFVGGHRGSLQEQLDRQLLTAWSNFANGGVEYAEMVDADGDGSADTSFIDLMTTAEAVRLDAASTRTQLEAQRDRLRRVNERTGL